VELTKKVNYMADVLPEVAELLKAGFAAKDKGDFRVARALFQAAVAESKKKRDREGEARSLLELSAIVYEFDKDLKSARKMLNDCLQIYTKLRSDRGRAYAMSNLGNLAFDGGDLRDAWKWETEAPRLWPFR
jgi:TPR repeat protein